MRSEDEEAALIRQFFRVARSPDSTQVQVRSIHWDGPGTPVDHWEVLADLARDVSQPAVDAAIQPALADPRWFLRCAECGALKPLGWMHDGETCQECAQKRHGVVY